MALLDQQQLRERVERLAAIERESASSGEARAAALIATELREAGASVTIEHEDVHGTYWWPVGLLCAKAGLAGLLRGRWKAVLAGGFATTAMIDDISGGKQWFRRRFLPKRVTTNVVAEIGDRDARHTVVVHAHHDAAHSGLVFDGGPPRSLLKRFPALAEKANTGPPTMWGAVAGPALVALGALSGRPRLRRTGVVLCTGYAVAMADIGRSQVVPGANDNLSGVAVLLSLAASLREEPIPGLRVILLSAGAEESFMEGMQAFARRHFADLPRDRTTFVCVDTVGSPHLLALEGEGMVWMNEYPEDVLARMHDAARAEGVELWSGLRLRNSTDALIPLRAGYPTAMLASCDRYKLPSNYHWPTDSADRLDYSTVAGCARVVRTFLTAIPTS